jgi:predicted RNase H-like HicB family nuclease
MIRVGGAYRHDQNLCVRLRSDPEGGYVVTCPALPGLVTHGETLDDARSMAQDAMAGLIDVLLEDVEDVPESDPPTAAFRYDRLAHALRNDAARSLVLEQLQLL